MFFNLTQISAFHISKTITAFFLFLITLGTPYGAQHFPNELRVMSFNIFYNGKMGRKGVSKVIKNSRADIIGLQETWGRTLKIISKKTGFHFARRAGILSRFPIVKVFNKVGNSTRGGVAIKLPGREKLLYVFNTHFRPYPYGPYKLRDGKLPNERVRLKQAKKLLKFIKKHTSQDDDIILVGDHNTPSHLDRPKSEFSYWKVSRALMNFGFRDSFRSIFPKATRNQGFTWVGRTTDRIDYVYFKGPNLSPLKSKILDGSNFYRPWPSDHSAVLTTFKWP